MTYYQRLKDVREDRDLTQNDIATILKIGQSDYSKYERGVNMMGIDKYIILAQFYNISLDYLAGLTNQPRTIDGSPYQIAGKNMVTINAPVKGNIDIH